VPLKAERTGAQRLHFEIFKGTLADQPQEFRKIYKFSRSGGHGSKEGGLGGRVQEEYYCQKIFISGKVSGGGAAGRNLGKSGHGWGELRVLRGARSE